MAKYILEFEDIEGDDGNPAVSLDVGGDVTSTLTQAAFMVIAVIDMFNDDTLSEAAVKKYNEMSEAEPDESTD